jgi:hypothetical protein
MQLLRQIVHEATWCLGPPGHSTQQVDLTLQEIVDAGRVTNPYQLFVLGRMAMFFKRGLKSADLQLENPVNFESGETSSELKSELEGLSDAERVSLAQYLLDCIKAGECMLYDQQMKIGEWIRFVLRKQD